MADNLKNKPDSYWKDMLTPEQYHVLREAGTETPGTGEHLYEERDGMFICAACKSPLFKSDSKYESTIPGLIGWPSFSEVAASSAVELTEDNSLGMSRTEVKCATCGSHLGHIFPDNTSPTGDHYCINSAALNFDPKDK